MSEDDSDEQILEIEFSDSDESEEEEYNLEFGDGERLVNDGIEEPGLDLERFRQDYDMSISSPAGLCSRRAERSRSRTTGTHDDDFSDEEEPVEDDEDAASEREGAESTGGEIPSIPPDLFDGVVIINTEPTETQKTTTMTSSEDDEVLVVVVESSSEGEEDQVEEGEGEEEEDGIYHDLLLSEFLPPERDCILRTWELYENRIVRKRRSRRTRVSDYDPEELIFRLPSQYVPIEVIGSGAFGIVISAMDADADEIVAIKKIRSAFAGSREAQKRLLREILLMLHFRDVDCTNVIRVRDVILPASLAEFEDVYLVMDMMESNLDDYLDRYIHVTGKRLKDDYVRIFMYEILKGVAQIHACGVIHRDLKPANILLNHNLSVALCDLGLARGIDFNEEMSTHYVVTRYYRAPELLLVWDKTGTAMDVWSVGCIMAELLSSGRDHYDRVFFRGKHWRHQMDVILSKLAFPNEVFASQGGAVYVEQRRKAEIKRHGFIRPRVPLENLFPDAHPEAVDLLKKLLVWNPHERLTALQAMQEPYFADLFEPEHLEVVADLFAFRFGKDIGPRESIKKIIFDEVTKFNRLFHGYVRVRIDRVLRRPRRRSRN